MLTSEINERMDKIESAIIQTSGEIGTIHELNQIIESVYGSLGTAFFNQLGLDELPRTAETDPGHTPRGEIAMAIHELIDFHVFIYLADSRLQLAKKQI